MGGRRAVPTHRCSEEQLCAAARATGKVAEREKPKHFAAEQSEADGRKQKKKLRAAPGCLLRNEAGRRAILWRHRKTGNGRARGPHNPPGVASKCWLLCVNCQSAFYCVEKNFLRPLPIVLVGSRWCGVVATWDSRNSKPLSAIFTIDEVCDRAATLCELSAFNSANSFLFLLFHSLAHKFTRADFFFFHFVSIRDRDTSVQLFDQ